MNPQVLGSSHVLFPVVREKKGIRRVASRRDRRLIDSAVRLERTHHVRKDFDVEVTKNVVIPLNISHMGFVGVRYQYQRIAFPKCGYQSFRYQKIRKKNRRPGFVELLEFHIQLSGLAQVPMILSGGDFSSFIRGKPRFIEKNFREGLTTQDGSAGKPLHSKVKVEVHDHFSKVE